MLKVPQKCPICGKPMAADIIECVGCGATVGGKGGASAHDRFDETRMEFVRELGMRARNGAL